MDAADIYSDLLAQLNETLLCMTSPEWDAASHRGSAGERRRALRQMLDIQQLRLALGNAVLLGIMEKLKANEADLENGRKHLREALTSLEQFGRVLDTIASYITIAGRIVPLL